MLAAVVAEADTAGGYTHQQQYVDLGLELPREAGTLAHPEYHTTNQWRPIAT